MVTDTDTTTDQVLDLIQAEYREMPGLSLTCPQIQRLWGLDSITCGEAIGALVTAHILKRTERGAYVLASATN